MTNSPSPKYQESFHLLLQKQAGGLYLPSEGTIKILRVAERHLRRLTDPSGVPTRVTFKVQMLVLSEVGVNNIFDQEDHERATQDGLDNHYRCLVRELVLIFVNLRIYHLVKLYNAKSKKHIVRHNFLKTIKFKGQ